MKTFAESGALAIYGAIIRYRGHEKRLVKVTC